MTIIGQHHQGQPRDRKHERGQRQEKRKKKSGVGMESTTSFNALHVHTCTETQRETERERDRRTERSNEGCMKGAVNRYRQGNAPKKERKHERERERAREGAIVEAKPYQSSSSLIAAVVVKEKRTPQGSRGNTDCEKSKRKKKLVKSAILGWEVREACKVCMCVCRPSLFLSLCRYVCVRVDISLPLSLSLYRDIDRYKCVCACTSLVKGSS